MYQIEKGIEVPAKKIFVGKSVYPFATMEVGDSFFVPQVDGKPKTDGSLRSSARQAAKKFGFKFTVRRVDGGFRCWRVE
jgi:hypothetical protein